MTRSFSLRLRDAAVRYRNRFRYEVRRPARSRAQIEAQLVPASDYNLGVPGGFSRVLAAHLASTPTTYWRNAPAATVGEITRVRRGEFDLLGHSIVVTPATDWHTDPVNHVRRAVQHVDSMADFGDGSDLVLLWHLNKMTFLIDHAAAWRATRDEAIARGVYDLIASWCDANPFMVGSNWRSPMETGTRLVAWSMALAALADAPSPDDATAEKIVRAVTRQAEFLAEHFSEWPIPNNHLVGEAAQLYAFAAYWPLLKQAPAWMARSEATLVAEAERQILKDGFQYENSVNYHAYSLDYFLVYLHGKALRQEAPHPVILRCVTAMADALIALVSPAGRMPMIGDDSVARFFVLRHWFDERALPAEGVTFADLVQPAQAALFLSTPWGRDLLTRHTPLVHARSFSEAGIDVARDADSHLVFTHGPQHHRLAAHGHLHADAGSFELELDGSPVFIDGGTGLYSRTREREHLRSAKAHNTLLVDGVEPMKSLHTFAWETVSAGEHLGFAASGDVVALGCRRKLPGTAASSFLHTRVLVKLGGVLLVADAVTPRGDAAAHWATLWFHTPLAPALVANEDARVRLTDASAFARIFEVHGATPPRVDVVTAPDDPLTLWSPCYGTLRHGSTVRVSTEFEKPLALLCALRPPDVSIETSLVTAGEVACAVETHGRRRIVVIHFDPFSVSVGGRTLAGAGVRPTAVASPTPMDWLDELEQPRS